MQHHESRLPESARPKTSVRHEGDLPARALQSSPYPAIIGKGLLAAARVNNALWDWSLWRVEEAQQHALRDLVRHARDTEFGRAHDFRRIRSYADYARRVPVGDYDAFSPAIERMRKGEQGILVPEFVRYFGNSSGSSVQGKSKFLPITERQIAHQKRAGADSLMRYLAWAKDEDFLSGFTLGLFPPTTMKEEGPVLITSNPALMATRMPFITRPSYLPHADVKVIPDYEKKLGVIAERYLDYDIRGVAGTTCWFTLLFEKVLAEAERRGRRARSISDVWPNLKVMLGGGVSAEPYLPVLRRLLGRDDATLIDTYNATEGGIYATSDHSGERGMLMLPHRGTFFEFVPIDERDRPSPARIPLWEVEKDRPYSIVVTTVSGLYSYEIGDIVRFTTLEPHRIEFMGRLSGCLSVTQELTTHVEIERAVAYAISRVPCRTLDFGAAADVGVDGTAKARYVLFAEFDEGADPSSLTELAAAFDDGLCKENRVYREHRGGNVAILPPRVVALVRGGAKRFMDEITRGNVQGKFPRILDDARKTKLLSYARPSSETKSPS
ncbi:MAG: GH3 auxin-responsive promoter family protein [Polyangiaceae bacterium]